MSEHESPEPQDTDVAFMKMAEQFGEISELATSVNKFYEVVMALYNEIESAFNAEIVDETMLEAMVKVYISAAAEQFGNVIKRCSNEYDLEEAYNAVIKLFYNDREMRKNLVAKYVGSDIDIVLEEDLRDYLSPATDQSSELDVEHGRMFYVSQLHEDLEDVVFAASINNSDDK